MIDEKEIIEKIEQLHNTVEGIKSEEDTVSNELKVVLVGSELQLIILKSTLGQSEEKVKSLAEKFKARSKDLNEKYAIASAENKIDEKSQLHAMIWTNDIRLDTLKWVLEEKEEEI